MLFCPATHTPATAASLPVRDVTLLGVQVKWNAFMNSVLPKKARAEGKLSLHDMQVVMNWKITKHTFRPLMGQVPFTHTHSRPLSRALARFGADGPR
jgi:hypothetical protein